jgi:hypothetical protein
MTIVRFAIWSWSVGWVGYGPSAFSNGNTLGAWISVCCVGAGVAVDGLLSDWAEAKRAQNKCQLRSGN